MLHMYITRSKPVQYAFTALLDDHLASKHSLTAPLDGHWARKHSLTALLDGHRARKYSLTALLDGRRARCRCWRKSLKRRNHVSTDLLIKISDGILFHCRIRLM